MLHLNNNGCMDVVCVSERDDSYCDVHSLSKNSYYLLKAPPPPKYSTMDPTDNQLIHRYLI